MPSENRPLPEPVLIQNFIAIWGPQVHMRSSGQKWGKLGFPLLKMISTHVEQTYKCILYFKKMMMTLWTHPEMKQTYLVTSLILTKVHLWSLLHCHAHWICKLIIQYTLLLNDMQCVTSSIWQGMRWKFPSGVQWKVINIKWRGISLEYQYSLPSLKCFPLYIKWGAPC